jgi:hypothetical protein
MAIILPVYLFISIGYFAWHDYSLSLDHVAFATFMEISKLPLSLLALSLPLAVLVARLHSTKQIAHQIKALERERVIEHNIKAMDKMHLLVDEISLKINIHMHECLKHTLKNSSPALKDSIGNMGLISRDTYEPLDFSRYSEVRLCIQRIDAHFIYLLKDIVQVSHYIRRADLIFKSLINELDKINYEEINNEEARYLAKAAWLPFSKNSTATYNLAKSIIDLRTPSSAGFYMKLQPEILAYIDCYDGWSKDGIGRDIVI